MRRARRKTEQGKKKLEIDKDFQLIDSITQLITEIIKSEAKEYKKCSKVSA